MINLPNLFLVLAASARLFFGAVPAIVPVGDEFKVAINVSSGGEVTLGTDAVILYDPKALEVSKIVPGDTYVVYPPNLQDIDNVHGKARFSGTASLRNPRAVEGILGWVIFRAKKVVNSTSINLDWKPTKTEESNIVPISGVLDLLSEEPPAVTVSSREPYFEEKIFIWIKRIFSFDFLNF